MVGKKANKFWSSGLLINFTNGHQRLDENGRVARRKRHSDGDLHKSNDPKLRVRHSGLVFYFFSSPAMFSKVSARDEIQRSSTDGVTDSQYVV